MTLALIEIPRSPTRRWWFVVISFVAVMLIIQSSCAVNPLLYSAKDASMTGSHQDLAATGAQSRTDVEGVLEEWAASLNLTGSIVHDIRLKDSKSAKRGLGSYRSSVQDLNDLITRLDMTDTDVATFQNDNCANILSIQALLNQTNDFYELQDVETTFRDQRNVAGLTSVKFQGEDLRVKIQKNYLDFAKRSVPMIGVSQKYGFDTSEFEESLADFAAILKEINAIQDKRLTSIPETIREIQCPGGICEAVPAISLEIHPIHGAYGDTLSMLGTVRVPVGTEVTVFVDGRQSGSAGIDQDGRFSFPYRIEQIDASTHTAYASVDTALSDISNFTVDSRNSSISLTVHTVQENGTVKGIGTGRLVTEDGIPVRSARVYLDIDGRVPGENGVTGDDGVFTVVTEQLAPGTHSLKARFDPDEFPLNGSESEPVTVEAPSRPNRIAAIVYFFGIGGAVVGAVLILRTRKEKDAPSPTTEAPPIQLTESTPVPTIEQAHLIVERATISSEGVINRNETIAQIYRQLVRELEARNPGLQLRWRTPRDLARLFADQPFGDQLAFLVGIHEKVRYADHESTDEDLELVSEAFTNIITEGDSH